MKSYYLQQILSTIFYLSNKLQTEGDKLDERLTMRQWMTLLSILHLPPNNASYNQIAALMGYSKQNAKKIVSTLEKKGFVTIEKNELDSRAVNVKVNDSCRSFLKQYFDNGTAYVNQRFADFSEEELETLWKLLKKLAVSSDSSWTGYAEKVPIEANRKDE